MDPLSLLQDIARLPDADRLRVMVALAGAAALLGAALPWPRPRRPRAPKPQPILRLRRPDLPWRLASRGPVAVPATARGWRRP